MWKNIKFLNICQEIADNTQTMKEAKFLNKDIVKVFKWLAISKVLS